MNGNDVMWPERYYAVCWECDVPCHGIRVAGHRYCEDCVHKMQVLADEEAQRRRMKESA